MPPQKLPKRCLQFEQGETAQVDTAVAGNIRGPWVGRLNSHNNFYRTFAYVIFLFSYVQGSALSGFVNCVKHYSFSVLTCVHFSMF